MLKSTLIAMIISITCFKLISCDFAGKVLTIFKAGQT